MFLRDLPPFVKNTLILIGLTLFCILIYNIAGVVAPVLVSLVLAYIINPMVRFLERRSLPRPWAVLSLFSIGIIFSIIIIVPVFIQIVSEGHELFNRVSEINVDKITLEYKTWFREVYLKHSQNTVVKSYLEVFLQGDKVQQIVAKTVVFLKDFLISITRNVFGFLMSTFSGVFGLALLPLLTFYILLDLDQLYSNSLLLIPTVYRQSAERILKDIDSVLSAFLRGQILSCIIFGSLMFVALFMCGLKFSAILGPVAGVANLVPYLGGVFTTVVSLLIAISQFGPTWDFLITMGKIAIALSIVQGIDGFIVQPKIIGENVGLHPVLVILALIIGGSMFGILGMFLSVPVTCIGKVLSRELYHELYDPN
ncbi:MAG: AI-2E family transporter [Candidatus Riflebacteria bacterium]|nr:AI-2E family transporter [Candidatus Riflebacteria bacterium]